mmetsp:Transcript_20948/g.31038  ORF Transcript_20948/g.31038 Transcript_20948/m.31038 type:complete len:371 (+) Transcript_20948:239-1351(+)
MEPTRTQMQYVFHLIRKNDWDDTLQLLHKNPEISTGIMIMNNNIKTTILHQAITSKGDKKARAIIMKTILDRFPEAAKIKNGYGSLPLHVICQRNTNIQSETKEMLVYKLMEVYPEALVVRGGMGGRTPIHIAFTDYISPELAKDMIEQGTSATFIKDKNGWLPIHVAASRHCSPKKLLMLLGANPDSLHARTGKGQTILSLATSTATKSHPNFTLIAEIKRQVESYTAIRKETESDDALHSRAYPQNRKPKAEAAELLLNFSKQTSSYDENVHRPKHKVVTPPKFSRPIHFYPPPPVASYHAPHHAPQHLPRHAPHHVPHHAPHQVPHHAPHYAPHHAPHYASHHASLNFHSYQHPTLTGDGVGEIAQV